MQLIGLGQSAEDLLAAFKTELVACGIELPKMSYIASGEIPWDGESLTLALGTIQQGQPGKNATNSARSPDNIITTATFHVMILRKCAVVGDEGTRLSIPTRAKMNAEGIQAIDDAGALMQAGILIKANQTIVPLGVDMAIGPVLPMGPAGGLKAMSLACEISLGTD